MVGTVQLNICLVDQEVEDDERMERAKKQRNSMVMIINICPIFSSLSLAKRASEPRSSWPRPKDRTGKKLKR